MFPLRRFAPTVPAESARNRAHTAGGSTTLQRRDEVRTSEEGRARLTFSGGEVTELGADTHVEVLELHQAPMSRGLVVFLALHQGKTMTRIRHMLFQGSRFVVETRVVSVEAHGTIFACDVLDTCEPVPTCTADTCVANPCTSATACVEDKCTNEACGPNKEGEQPSKCLGRVCVQDYDYKEPFCDVGEDIIDLDGYF